jgi:hypothetical protein
MPTVCENTPPPVSTSVRAAAAYAGFEQVLRRRSQQLSFADRHSNQSLCGQGVSRAHTLANVLNPQNVACAVVDGAQLRVPRWVLKAGRRDIR